MITNYQQRIDDIVRKCFRKHIRKVENLKPSEWIEKYVVLSEMSSSIPGPYEFSSSPAWLWVSDLMGDPDVRRISVMKSVQLGGTQWMINCILYSIGNLGLPLLYVGQTEKDVKKFLKAKFGPVEADCEPVASMRTKKSEAWNEISYETCLMDIGWGSSANSVASTSKGVVILDEVDKYVQKDKSDVHPAQGARERVTGFPDNHKLLETSTPTDESGEIAKCFNEGSQHVLHFACPSCGFRQDFVFSRSSLVWSEEARDEEGTYDLNLVEKTAVYNCQNPDCDHQITEEERLDVLEDLVPYQKNPNASKSHVSLHVSAFYSKFMTLGKIAVRFLVGRRTPNGLRAFYTQILGLPFVQQAITNDEDTIRTLQKRTPFSYLRSPISEKPVELPCRVAFISTTVDVQKDSFWIMQCAFTKDGHCMILDWGQIYGYNEIQAWVKRVYTYKGRKYTSRFNLIDSGYQAKALGGVYLFVIRSKGLFLPCVGRDNRLFEVIQEKAQTFRGISFNLYSFQDPYFKEILYQHRMKSFSKEQLWFPRVLDNDLISQLTDERLVEEETKDGRVMKWKSKEDNNHLGDTLKMQMVLWEKLGAESVESWVDKVSLSNGE